MLRAILSVMLLVSSFAFAADIASEYTGTWSSDGGSSDGKLRLTLNKSGDAWDCKLVYWGTDQPEVTPKQASCAVEGNKVKAQYEAQGDGGAQHIILEAATAGGALEGTYKVTGDDGQALDSGKWKASAAH